MLCVCVLQCVVYACMLVIVAQCQFCQATSYTMLFPSNATDVTHTHALQHCNLTTSSSCLRSASLQCRSPPILRLPRDVSIRLRLRSEWALEWSGMPNKCFLWIFHLKSSRKKRSARRHFISNCCSVLVESRKRNKNKYFSTWRHLQLLVDKSLISWWIWCVFRGRIWHSVKA